MPTIITHALTGIAFGHVHPVRQWPVRFWVLSVLCTMLPDADVIAFSFGIPYDHLLGHRGLSHSLPFAFVVGLVVVGLAFRPVQPLSKTWWGLVLYFSLVTASHGIFDALTDGGLGVAFFSPFDTSRYFFPWRPLRVSPIGAGFFSARGAETLLSEAIWLGVPSVLVIGARRGLFFLRHKRK